MQTFELDALIGISIIALLVGFLIGLAMGRTVLRGKRSLNTEAELQASQEALTNYRAEVYDQFAQTARKFDTLNESYNDLHRHLASSANVLLGDGISTPLLRGPAEPVPEAEPKEVQAEETPVEEESVEEESVEKGSEDETLAEADTPLDTTAQDTAAADPNVTDAESKNPEAPKPGS